MAEPDARQPVRRLRIAFVSTMCLLDRISGAAISVRSALETLAEAGHEVSAFTASLFDSNAEVPFGPALGPEAADAGNRGKVLVLTRNGVEHRVLLTASSQGRNLKSEEAQRLFEGWRGWVRAARPDLVVSFGNSTLSRQLQAEARAAGARVVLYFGNAEIDTAGLVQPGDSLICCSDYLAGLYRGRYGVTPQVMHPVIRPERVRRPGLPVLADHAELRQLGFVTFINPIPHKGLTLLIRLVARAARERPGMKFLILESRMPRERMAEMNLDLPTRPNVWWMQAQSDMAAIYARTAVLLVPSFWREGFGRSVVEAQLAGVPVLAADNGGLPEALAGGADPLPVPEKCVANHLAYPDPTTVETWFRALTALWDDAGAYRRAATRARQAGERFTPEANRVRVLEIFHGFATAGAVQRD